MFSNLNLKTRILIILILHLKLKLIFSEVFDECDGVENDTFVASSTDCQMYIYCDDEDSMSGQCSDDQYFDGVSCDAKENVYCPLDELATDEDEDNDEEVGDGDESEEIDPEIPTTMTTTIAPTTTTTSLSTLSTDDNIITTTMEPLTIAPIIKDRCPLTDDPNEIVLISNSESCADYYLCYHGHAIEMHCTNHLHFNSYTGKCDFPENVQCQNDRPNANKCLPHITDFFPHPDNCNYFYYCIKGYLTVQQCPFYYGWDIKKRSCVQILQAECYNGAKKNIKA